MRGPEGRLAKRQPSPEGLEINPENDLPAPACRGSAVGAALNLGPLAPVSLRADATKPPHLLASRDKKLFLPSLYLR